MEGLGDDGNVSQSISQSVSWSACRTNTRTTLFLSLVPKTMDSERSSAPSRLLGRVRLVARSLARLLSWFSLSIPVLM